MMVDKAWAKRYAASIIGEEHIIPTLGVWEHFDNIDFATLPDKFVLKTTNGGGGCGVVICRDKAAFNREDAKKNLKLLFAVPFTETVASGHTRTSNRRLSQRSL